jgi:hypothetical protein
MINKKSKKREIADLQRFLSELGFLDWGASSDDAGEWGDDTAAAVAAAYEDLGWDHPKAGTWISAAALAVLAGGDGRSGGGQMTRGLRSGGGQMTRGDGDD